MHEDVTRFAKGSSEESSVAEKQDVPAICVKLRKGGTDPEIRLCFPRCSRFLLKGSEVLSSFFASAIFMFRRWARGPYRGVKKRSTTVPETAHSCGMKSEHGLLSSVGEMIMINAKKLNLVTPVIFSQKALFVDPSTSLFSLNLAPSLTSVQAFQSCFRLCS